MTGAFAHWDAQAGVRAGVRRIFADEEGKVFFPTSLVPHLSHPLTANLPQPERDALTLRHLYQFLLSTTHVETRVVNQGAELIANGRAGVTLPVAGRIDAFRVYTDEGYHALYSLDLADQIASATGVALPPWDYGSFVNRLASAGASLLPGEPVLALLLQVVVFETLITAVLNELPNDDNVVTTVRDVMRDHARDEGRHHRFFTAFFHELWAQLDAPLRTRVAGTLPELIHVCLMADTVPVSASLKLSGLDDEAIAQVLADTYQLDATRLAQITRSTVNMCQSAGVFEVPGAAESFAAAGIVVPYID